MAQKPKQKTKQNKRNHQSFHLTLNADDFHWLYEWCVENDSTTSQEVRKLIRKFRARHDKKKS